MKSLKFLSILYYLGMALVLIGTVAGISKFTYAAYILAVGVLPIIFVRLYNRIVAIPERKRINGILLISSLLMACGVILLFMGENYWIVGIFTAAVLDIYATFRRIA